MSEFLDEIFKTIRIMMDDPIISSVFLGFLVLYPIVVLFRILGSFTGCGNFHFGDCVVSFFEWIWDKFVVWLCSSDRGFEIADSLGWAEPGVHYFACGVDCDKCPNYDQCTNELRILRDVTHVPAAAPASDPKTVLQEVDS